MISLSCEAEHLQAQEAIHAALAKSDSLYSHWPKQWQSNHCLQQEQSHPAWICLTWKANPNYTVSLTMEEISVCKYSYTSPTLKYHQKKNSKNCCLFFFFFIYLVILIHRIAVQGRWLQSQSSVWFVWAVPAWMEGIVQNNLVQTACAYGSVSHCWQNNTAPTCALWFQGEAPYYVVRPHTDGENVRVK